MNNALNGAESGRNESNTDGDSREYSCPETQTSQRLGKKHNLGFEVEVGENRYSWADENGGECGDEGKFKPGY
jgi:hypothetical protein